MIGGEAYRPFYEAMRKRWGYCGPYRLGIAIGEAGSDLPNPFSNARSVKNFDDGRLVGEMLRRREKAERNIRTAIWNAARNGGMQQDLALALINRAMAEPTMLETLAVIG